MSTRAELPPQIGQRVVRLELPAGGVGCGVLVAKDRMLTCHHVLPGKLTARSTVVSLACDDVAHPQYDPEFAAQIRRPDVGFFRTCRALDYTAVALRPAGTPGPDHLPEVAECAEPVLGEELVIVERRPARQGGLRITLTHVAALTGPFVQYPGPTTCGSSGAPVFNRAWQLVAIHHKRGFLPGPGGEVRLCSQAVRISEIHADAGWAAAVTGRVSVAPDLPAPW